MAVDWKSIQDELNSEENKIAEKWTQHALNLNAKLISARDRVIRGKEVTVVTFKILDGENEGRLLSCFWDPYYNRFDILNLARAVGFSGAELTPFALKNSCVTFDYLPNKKGYLQAYNWRPFGTTMDSFMKEQSGGILNTEGIK